MNVIVALICLASAGYLALCWKHGHSMSASAGCGCGGCGGCGHGSGGCCDPAGNCGVKPAPTTPEIGSTKQGRPNSDGNKKRVSVDKKGDTTARGIRA